MRPESTDPGIPNLFRFRQALIWASAISFVSILVTVWAWCPTDVGRLLAVVALLPFLMPYAFIPFRLYGQNLRSGLNLAIAMGCALLVPGVMLVHFAALWDRRWWILGNLSVGLVMQLVLIAVSIKTYIPLPRVRYGRTKLLASFTYGLFVFAYFWIAYSPVPGRIASNEGVAKRYLEDSAVAADLDAFEHGGLYPESVGSMGPSPNPQCTTTSTYPAPSIDYIFEYRGIRPLPNSQDCNRFKGYTITARPAVYRKTGVRSFRITNGGLAIHFTAENRPATDTDSAEYVRHAPN